MPYTETSDKTRLFHIDWGSGKPVVFAHAWGLNSDMWNYQLPSFIASGLRCVAFDRRGHGRSDRPGRGYDYDTFADDLAALIERLDLRDVTLVGHSAGCGEVVRYLSRHGDERVERVVLLAPVTPLIVKTEDNPEGLDPAVLAAGAARADRRRPRAGAPRTPRRSSEPRPYRQGSPTGSRGRSSTRRCRSCSRPRPRTRRPTSARTSRR